MIKRSILPILLISLILLSVPAYPQTDSYRDFYKQFFTTRSDQIQEDAQQLEQLLDSWNNGEISQSTVVAKLREMEDKADRYFEQALRLPPPAGEFDKHKKSIYIFVTWTTIMGLFTEGLSDLDLGVLDAANTLANYVQNKVDRFEMESEETEHDTTN